jgi:hypothetical protein
MLTILASGQSNAMGFNPGGPDAFDRRLTVWNNPNDTYEPDTLGDGFVAPGIDRPPFVRGANCFMVHAASEIARRTGEDVRLVLVTKGGIPISTWMDEAGTPGPMYERLIVIAKRAGIGAADFFLWHQGEGDNKAPEGYPQKWGHLTSGLRQEGLIGDTTPMIVGETAAMWPRINPVLRDLPAQFPNVRFVPLADFDTSDGRHFLGEDALAIGKRYAEAALGSAENAMTQAMGAGDRRPA